MSIKLLTLMSIKLLMLMILTNSPRANKY